MIRREDAIRILFWVVCKELVQLFDFRDLEHIVDPFLGESIGVAIFKGFKCLKQQFIELGLCLHL